MERNDPCWCGSGKKYKKCHMPIEEKIKLHRDRGEIVPSRKLLKTPAQIEKIKKSAALNTAVLDEVAAHIRAGMSTAEIDKIVYDFTTAHGGIPAPLNYQGFPKSVCTSINNEVCHGIPDENIILQEGDIINVDVSTILDGYFSDASRMFMIGEVSDRALQRQNHGDIWEILQMRSIPTHRQTATLLLLISAVTESDWNSTKIRLSAMSHQRAARCCSYPE